MENKNELWISLNNYVWWCTIIDFSRDIIKKILTIARTFEQNSNWNFSLEPKIRPRGPFRSIGRVLWRGHGSLAPLRLSLWPLRNRTSGFHIHSPLPPRMTSGWNTAHYYHGDRTGGWPGAVLVKTLFTGGLRLGRVPSPRPAGELLFVLDAARGHTISLRDVTDPTEGIGIIGSTAHLFYVCKIFTDLPFTVLLE